MKKLYILLFLLLILSFSVFAGVDTRLTLVSNTNGVLVVDVQAMSNSAEVKIGLYRGAFKISETLENRVKSVKFSEHYFAP